MISFKLMKFCTLLFLFFATLVNSAQACKCGVLPLLDNYQRSAFVGTARIIKVNRAPGNAGQEILEIDITKLYKGDPIKKIRAFSRAGSCSFKVSENSNWLIFASLDNGELSFGFCSGSLQLDAKVDEVKFPALEGHYKRQLSTTLAALDFIVKNKISSNKPDSFYARESCTGSLTGFKNKDSFAVYEVKLQKDLSVKEVNILKGFQNKELSDMIVTCLKSALKINSSTAVPVPEEISLIFMYYFKGTGSKDGKSYVSQDHVQYPAAVTGYPHSVILYP